VSADELWLDLRARIEGLARTLRFVANDAGATVRKEKVCGEIAMPRS